VRLDSHQHFWRYDPAQHTWMTDAMSALRRDFLPRDLEPLLGATGFEGTIAMQARQVLEETEWLLQLAESHPFIRGVIGWVDLRSPSVGDQLARFARHPRLVGVRHVVHDEPDDEFVLRPDFRAGIARLRDHGLTYDLRPYLDAVVEAFGVERLMIGSDWPVCTLSSDYSRTMALVVDYVQQFAAEARDGILGGNGARFYGLDRPRGKA